MGHHPIISDEELKLLLSSGEADPDRTDGAEHGDAESDTTAPLPSDDGGGSDAGGFLPRSMRHRRKKRFWSK